MASLLPPGGEAPQGLGCGGHQDESLLELEQFFKTYTPFDSLPAYLDFESPLPRQYKDLKPAQQALRQPQAPHHAGLFALGS